MREIRISKLIINNFRSIEHLEIDLGQHNVFVGPNNTGKSNVLRAIACIYNDKQLGLEDMRKDTAGQLASNFLEITATFTDFSTEQQSKLEQYYYDGHVKVTVRCELQLNEEGEIVTGENGVSLFKTSVSGYLCEDAPQFPTDFENASKVLLLAESLPKKDDLRDTLLESYYQGGRITNEAWTQIKDQFYQDHLEITFCKEEQTSPTQLKGWAKLTESKLWGKLLFVPAIKNPSDELSPGKPKSEFQQLINQVLGGIEDPEIQQQLSDVQEKLEEEQRQRLVIIQDELNEELKMWDATVTLEPDHISADDLIPTRCQMMICDGIPTEATQKGTGLQRYAFFKLLKIAFQHRHGDETPLILLFEEPEAHLHPQYQKEMAKILRDLTQTTQRNIQTLITTHSPHFINVLQLDEIYRFSKRESYSTLTPPVRLSLENDREELKTMLFFDARVNEIFFADRIVVFEGNSEEVALNILKVENNWDLSKVAIISANGKGNILTYLNVLNKLLIPYFVIIDEDPYFGELCITTNPNEITDKKKAYKLNQKITTKVNEVDFGHLFIIPGDFDQFVGISKNSNKPLGVKNRLNDLISQGPCPELDNITNLFQSILMSEDLPNDPIIPGGDLWQEKTPEEIRQDNLEREPTFDGLKASMQNTIKNYKKVILQLDEDQREELQGLFDSSQPNQLHSSRIRAKKEASKKSPKKAISKGLLKYTRKST